MGRKSNTPTVEDQKLKAILIEHFEKWKSLKSNSIRNQKRVVAKCESLTESGLSRILSKDDKKCPTLGEAIEVFMTIEGMEAFERYVKNTNTVSCHYLRSLLKGKKNTFVAAEPILDKSNLLVEINDKLDKTKNELSMFDKLFYQMQGGVFAAPIVAYVIFMNRELFLGKI
jgi:hypothetical protein